MSHATSRRIRRRSNTTNRAPTLADTLRTLEDNKVPVRSLGARRFGARILEAIDIRPRGGFFMMFRHPTKRAAQGRMCVLSA